MKIFCIVLSVLFSINSFAQHKKAYQLFDVKGNEVDYNLMLENAFEYDIILFGEIHNNPISHWLRLELTKGIFQEAADNFVLGAEMFEADDQLILDEYFEDLISESNFEAEAKLWNNYKTDYRPIVEYAKENNINFIATNIPRRYAAMVNQGGFEALEKLTDKSFDYIAPLPIDYNPELPGYKKMLEMASMHPHHSENFPKAQAIKDATMAYFIYENFEDENIFLHLNGAYHSNNYEGIVWYLKNLDEELNIMTISTVEQSKIKTLDEKHYGLADFIIAVSQTMTKTY